MKILHSSTTKNETKKNFKIPVGNDSVCIWVPIDTHANKYLLLYMLGGKHGLEILPGRSDVGGPLRLLASWKGPTSTITEKRNT